MQTATRQVLAAAAASVLLGGMAGGPAAATEPEAPSSGLGAAGGLRYKKQVATTAGSSALQPTTAVAQTWCEKDRRTTSGGVSISTSVAQQGIASSSMMLAPRQWYAEAWSRHDVPTSVIGYAVCMLSTKLSSEYVWQDELAPDSQATGVAYCEEGHAVGGGMAATGEPWDYSLNASYPVDSSADADSVPDDGWRSYTQYSGEGEGYSGAGSTAGAMFDVTCFSGARPAYRSRTVTVPAFGTVAAQATCPSDRPAMGGGVYVSGAAWRSHMVTTRPWDGSDAGTVPEDGWRGAVMNTSDTDLTLTVHAVCR